VRHGGLRERRQISPLLRTLAPTPKSEKRPARLPQEDKGDALRSLLIESDFPVDATTREQNGESRRRKPYESLILDALTSSIVVIAQACTNFHG
jgi:hypothetical protein